MKSSRCLSALAAVGVGLIISGSAAMALDAVARTAVNVRSGPGKSNDIVDVLNAGEAVEVTECQKGWCYVQHTGSDGWVGRSFLVFGEVVRDTGTSEPPAQLQEQGACKPGYVWREASPDDHVCVRPTRRAEAQHENSVAKLRVDPTGDAGPNSCRGRFVWREAYDGDVVCVSKDRREQVRRENESGPSLRVTTP